MITRSGSADQPPTAEQTGELLMAVARGMRRGLSTELANLDLTPAQAKALRIVMREGEPRLSELAARLRIAPRSATELVDALESQGFVERCADPSDRRATCVRPTTAGLALSEQIDQARARAGASYLIDLNETDRAHLHRILAQLEVHS